MSVKATLIIPRTDQLPASIVLVDESPGEPLIFHPALDGTSPNPTRSSRRRVTLWFLARED